MADILNSSFGQITKRFKDMSDGTYAEVVSTSSGTGATASQVQGNVADNAAAGTPNVLIVGGQYNATPPAYATGDAAALQSTSSGALLVKQYAAPDNDWTYAAAASGISNTTTAVTIKAAGAAGLRNYITSLQITAEALGAATEFAIRDGAGGAVLWRCKIGTAGIVNGISITFPSPIKGTAATLLEVVTLTASITGAVYVNAQGYIAP